MFVITLISRVASPWMLGPPCMCMSPASHPAVSTARARRSSTSAASPATRSTLNDATSHSIPLAPVSSYEPGSRVVSTIPSLVQRT